MPESQLVSGLLSGAGIGHSDALGPYRLVRELGMGGQGIVYEAIDSRLGRRVALKVLRSRGAESEMLLARFHREAAIAAKVDHPGICTVFETAIESGIPYIAMRFVDGESLARKIQKTGRPDTDSETTHLVLDDGDGAPGTPAGDDEEEPPTHAESGGRREIDRIVRLFERIARALHAVHEAGIIHRDIKPGNIMVTPEGEPVIMDFGLSRDDSGDLPTLTAEGDLFGTPAYMSPEQLTRQAIKLDRRTDIWSLGVTLYECLTQKRPFEAPTREGLYQTILGHEPPDIRRLNAEIPSDLRVVIETALQKNRERRYQSALDLAEDLRRVAERQPILARRAGPVVRLLRWAERHPGVAASLSALILVLAGGLATSLHLLGTTRAERNRADGTAESLRLSIAESARLVDLGLAEDLDRRAEADLWPATPEKVPAMTEWLAEARGLVARLPRHAAHLSSLRISVKGGGGSGVGSGPMAPGESSRERVLVRQLEVLVNRLEALRSDGGRHSATIPGMESRLETARTLAERSIGHPRWPESIEAAATIPEYAGLPLRPQLGLIPLGADPDTGLLEFAHLASGAPPVRDAEGTLRIAEVCGLVFVLIPGGTYLVGAQSSAASESHYDPGAYAAEGPPQRVPLSPFLISKFEMTQAQWWRLTGADPSQYSPARNTGRTGDTSRLHPVESVDATTVAEVLRRIGCVLPTEAQWEAAARGRTTTPWWTGGEAESLDGAANLFDRSAWTAGYRDANVTVAPEADDGFAATAPVDTLLPNPFGLHHVHGNVGEWCRDLYAPYANVPAAPGDGFRDQPDSDLQVHRGGSFLRVPRDARSAFRLYGRAVGYSHQSVGVRPARTLDR